jgi:competence protein ComEC
MPARSAPGVNLWRKPVLRIHFLNVGHGDSKIIEHPSGRLTMIDINNSQDYDSETFGEVLAEQREKERTQQLANALTAIGGNPLIGIPTLANPFGPTPNVLGELTAAMETAKKEITDPVAFLQKHYSGRRLWRFIQTHPDLDHMRGLKRLHDTIGFDNFWDTAHAKPTPNFQSDADKTDWTFYQQIRSGSAAKNYLRGMQCFAFAMNEDGSPGGDLIEILSPTGSLIDTCNDAGKSNDLSFVLRVWHAGKSVLLPGDIEKAGWDDLFSSFGALLKSDIMHASHHGRESGYHLPSLKLVNPFTIVVSVGRKPDSDATKLYRAQCSNVFSTRHYGNLELRIHDDGTIKWLAERIGS